MKIEPIIVPGICAALLRGIALTLILIVVSACETVPNGSAGGGSRSQMGEQKTVDFPFSMEAELLILGDLPPDTSIPNFSGQGARVLEPGEGGRVSFGVRITETKMYTLTMRSYIPEESSLELFVNGERLERVKVPQTNNYTHIVLPPLFLEEGEAIIGMGVRTGRIIMDTIELKESLTELGREIDPNPVNPNASKEVKVVLQYLAEGYGKRILSGQQDLTWDDRIDMVERVFASTGKKPAILGFDFMNYKGNNDVGNGLRQVEEAIEYWNKGGLITFCWHWRMGQSNEFYSARTNFRIKLQEGSEELALLLKDIDALAVQLKRLEAAGVPILWRPLHEASGGWFWWGASGPQAQIDLWRLLYDRLTNFHGINNLIWVWNGQNAAWYPGDDVVDIIGMDIYGSPGTSLVYRDSWVMAQAMVGGEQSKLVALTENGPIPDPDQLLEQDVPWLWFMTWNDGNKNDPDQDFWSSEKIMSLAYKQKVYQHPYVITLDELPNFR